MRFKFSVILYSSHFRHHHDASAICDEMLLTVLVDRWYQLHTVHETFLRCR